MNETGDLGEFLCGRTFWSRTTPEWSRTNKWSRSCIFTQETALRLVARTQVVAHTCGMVAHLPKAGIARLLPEFRPPCLLLVDFCSKCTMKLCKEGIYLYRVIFLKKFDFRNPLYNVFILHSFKHCFESFCLEMSSFDAFDSVLFAG